MESDSDYEVHRPNSTEEIQKHLFRLLRNNNLSDVETFLIQNKKKFPLLINTKNDEGYSPLDIAIEKKNRTIARMLIRSGADPKNITLPLPTHWTLPTNGGKRRNKKSKKNKRKSKKRKRKTNKRRRN
jgi:ankyrin repeat protein